MKTETVYIIRSVSATQKVVSDQCFCSIFCYFTWKRIKVYGWL